MVVVDEACFEVDAVVDDFVIGSAEVFWVAVGEMAAVFEAHGEDFVAGLEGGEVDGEVGLAAGVRLDVSVVGAEEFASAVDGELFNFVDVLTAAVVAFSWVAFSVFVGKDAACSFEDGWEGEVF